MRSALSAELRVTDFNAYCGLLGIWRLFCDEQMRRMSGENQFDEPCYEPTKTTQPLSFSYEFYKIFLPEFESRVAPVAYNLYNMESCDVPISDLHTCF